MKGQCRLGLSGCGADDAGRQLRHLHARSLRQLQGKGTLFEVPGAMCACSTLPRGTRTGTQTHLPPRGVELQAGHLGGHSVQQAAAGLQILGGGAVSRCNATGSRPVFEHADMVQQRKVESASSVQGEKAEEAGRRGAQARQGSGRAGALPGSTADGPCIRRCQTRNVSAPSSQAAHLHRPPPALRPAACPLWTSHGLCPAAMQ